MKTLIQIGLIGAAAWFALRNWFDDGATGAASEPAPPTAGNGTAATTPAAVPQPPQGAPPPAAPIPPPPVTPAVTFNILAAMRAEAPARNFGPLMTFEEWNWLFEQLRGVPGPDWEIFGRPSNPDRGYKMSIDEWYALASKSPLISGLAGLAGMGRYTRWPRR